MKQKIISLIPVTVHTLFDKAEQYVTTCMLCFSIVVHTQYRIQHRQTGHRQDIQHSFPKVFHLCARHSSSFSYKVCRTTSYTLCRARLRFLKTPNALSIAMIYKTVEAFHTNKHSITSMRRQYSNSLYLSIFLYRIITL